jgi:hypothetical protein
MPLDISVFSLDANQKRPADVFYCFGLAGFRRIFQVGGAL